MSSSIDLFMYNQASTAPENVTVGRCLNVFQKQLDEVVVDAGVILLKRKKKKKKSDCQMFKSQTRAFVFKVRPRLQGLCTKAASSATVPYTKALSWSPPDM